MVQLEHRFIKKAGSWSYFQFHYGSIRTCARFSATVALVSFNSIMVQLELCVASVDSGQSLAFNSIMVQLEQASLS